MANDAVGRRILRTKERKSYQDNLEDEIEGRRRFDVHEKLNSDKYKFADSENHVRNMEGKDFNLQFIQEHGFTYPLKFGNKDGLGLRMPSPDHFDVNDVKSYVGARRMVDVVDTSTQQPVEMTMAQWTKYFGSPDKDRILNVISLEFSHTGMDRLVEPPELVRKIDWVNVMWPPELIEQQKDTTNNLDDMKYPKVRKYVLMSVGGCYTDFHIDFGGTSVWYHILKGEKVFWIIEPTDENLAKYEKWTLSTKQEDVFFGDLVEKCCLINLKAGDTFMIPSGWIHAVYTPCDSLVFGGNFIHSFSVTQQIRISEIEHRTKVPNRFRFPFYPQIHWYAAKRYTEMLEKDVELRGKRIGSSEEFLENKENYGNIKNDVEKSSQQVKHEIVEALNGDVTSSTVLEENSENEDKSSIRKEPHWDPVNLTDSEVKGVKKLIARLRTWDRAVNNCPAEISDQEALLDRLEELVEMHENDDAWLAAKGIDIFEQIDLYMEETGCTPYIHRRQKAKIICDNDKPEKVRKARAPSGAASRKRRLRCGQCEGCNRGNCGECKYCLDMPKFGGPGKMKQSCIYRICLNPTLPTSAKCSICNDVKTDDDDPIMECSICANLSHPGCLDKRGPCRISDTLNNCWECPNCCKDEEAGDFDPNLVRGKMDPLKRKLAASVGSTDVKDEEQGKRRKHSTNEEEKVNEKSTKKPRVESVTDSEEEQSANEANGSDEDETRASQRRKQNHKLRLKPLHIELVQLDPKLVVRPRPISPAAEEVALVDGSSHPLPKGIWLRVFRYLSQRELSLCMRVCLAWNRWGLSHDLWTHLRVSERKMDSTVLEGIVRRQPITLSLSHCNVTHDQVKWLLARLPSLKHLCLTGNSSSAVSALRHCYYTDLQSLDISWCEGLKDGLVLDLFSHAENNTKRSKGRFCSLKRLVMSGCDVTDETMEIVARCLPSLEFLDVSYCTLLTDSGVDNLTNEASLCRDILKQIDFSGCNQLTAASSLLLRQCAKKPKIVTERCDKLQVC